MQYVLRWSQTTDNAAHYQTLKPHNFFLQPGVRPLAEVRFE